MTMVAAADNPTGEIPVLRSGPSRLIGSTGRRPGDSAVEPPTGPHPMVDLLDGHLHLTYRREYTVVALDGGLDEPLARRLAPAVAEASVEADAVIVDLDDVALLDRGALDLILGALDAAGEDTPKCLIAGRISGKLVLDRWGVLDRFAVFASTADAMQARAFAASGYGAGWTVGS